MKQFDQLIEKIHLGVNPYAGFKADQWPADPFNEWGSTHPWFAESIERVKPELIIEVGSFLGGSAIHQAEQLAAHGMTDSAVLCVDTWLAEQVLWSHPEVRPRLKIQNGRPAFYNTFLANVLAAGQADKIVPLPMPSLSAGRYLRQLGLQAQMIYIDGSHEEGDCYRDLEMFWPLLTPGGVMLVDDYGADPSRFAGLMRDVQKFVREKNLHLGHLGDKARLWK